MKLQNPRLDVVALETRELLSAVIVESEPNNAKAAADVVTFDPADSTALLSGSISGRKNQDFFQFSTDSPSTMNLNCTGSGRLACRVSVEDSVGRKLFETQPNNGIESGTFNVDAGQEVFIRVRGRRHSDGDYSILMTLSPSPQSNETSTGSNEANIGSIERSPLNTETNIVTNDTRTDSEPANDLIETEPNDSTTLANQFDLGSDGLIRLEGSVVNDGDVDFFVFTPATSGTLNVVVQANRAVSATLEIETASGVKLFETDPNNGLNSGTVEVTAGMTYFIRFSSPIYPSAPYVVDLALQ